MLLCFIVKGIPGASQEKFIYNVSPSIITHVNQLHREYNLLLCLLVEALLKILGEHRLNQPVKQK